MKKPSAQLPATVAVFIVPAQHPVKVFNATPQQRLDMVLREISANAPLEPEAEAPESARQAVCLRADAVYEKGTLLKLAQLQAALVTADDGTPLAAVTPVNGRAEAAHWLTGGAPPPPEWPVVKVGELGSSYNRSLRKSEPPFACVVTAENRASVEERIYRSTYKGVTDLVTKYLWPKPALLLTRWFLRAGLSPNLITLVSVCFMLAALWLFKDGAFGLGLVAAWIMALLDTVDGKMARVSHRSSTFGEVLDHGMDLLHPPFWYLAWMCGLEKTGHPLPDGWFGPGVLLIVSTYVFIRLSEGYFIRRFGFHLHVWRRFDSDFRLVVARRNPNLILLTSGWLIGRPDLGFLSLVVWQLVAAIVHVLQIVNAEWSSRRSQLRSWLEVEAEASFPREQTP
jgi:phosphatidylglycerophosphate synthase